MALNAEKYEKYLVLYIPYHVRDIFYFLLVKLGICKIGSHILIYLISEGKCILKRMSVRKKKKTLSVLRIIFRRVINK